MVSMDNIVKKLNIKLGFEFEDQEDFNDLNFDVSLKTNEESKHIKILDRKVKRRNSDASTKLF